MAFIRAIYSFHNQLVHYQSTMTTKGYLIIVNRRQGVTPESWCKSSFCIPAVGDNDFYVNYVTGNSHTQPTSCFPVLLFRLIDTQKIVWLLSIAGDFFYTAAVIVLCKWSRYMDAVYIDCECHKMYFSTCFLASVRYYLLLVGWGFFWVTGNRREKRVFGNRMWEKKFSETDNKK